MIGGGGHKRVDLVEVCKVALWPLSGTPARQRTLVKAQTE
jgi:hypothetical protein